MYLSSYSIYQRRCFKYFMKLGSAISLFSSCGEQRYQKMKACGFDYADVGISGELDGKSEQEYEKRWLDEKLLAQEAGVTIGQVHGPWRYPPHDETTELRAERADVMRRSIRVTGMLGCRFWVIHPIMPYGPDSDFDTKRFWSINYDFFTALLPTARENKVTICFENMPMKNLSISTPEKTLEFVSLMDDEHFQFCLDTGHCAVFGIQPADAARMAGDRLKVMHVHDNRGKRDEHLLPYTGIIDWADYRLALAEIGYNGVFSLENGWNECLPNAPMKVKFECLAAVAKQLVQ